MYLGSETGLGRQIKYADRSGELEVARVDRVTAVKDFAVR
jgi:hypothetical protein